MLPLMFTLFLEPLVNLGLRIRSALEFYPGGREWSGSDPSGSQDCTTGPRAGALFKLPY